MAFVISAVFVAATAWAMRGMRGLRYMIQQSLWQVEDRCDKASNKAEHLEMRAMQSVMRPHEFLRIVSQFIQDFDPSMDRVFLLRRFADECTRFIEVRVKVGLKGDACPLLRLIVRMIYDRFGLCYDHEARARMTRTEATDMNTNTPHPSLPFFHHMSRTFHWR